MSFSGEAALPQFENELTCVREFFLFFLFFFYDDSVGRRDDLIHALRLTRHLWYSIMARALSIFFSARGDELVAADVDADDER